LHGKLVRNEQLGRKAGKWITDKSQTFCSKKKSDLHNISRIFLLFTFP
jgi:hypothetical protein